LGGLIVLLLAVCAVAEWPYTRTRDNPLACGHFRRSPDMSRAKRSRVASQHLRMKTIAVAKLAKARYEPTQDDGLKRYLSYLIRVGQLQINEVYVLTANHILRACGDSGLGVSPDWATRWMTRNKDWFKTIRAKHWQQRESAVHDKTILKGI